MCKTQYCIFVNISILISKNIRFLLLRLVIHSSVKTHIILLEDDWSDRFPAGTHIACLTSSMEEGGGRLLHGNNKKSPLHGLGASTVLTGEELPRLVGFAKVDRSFKHPQVWPRGVGKLDENVGHMEKLLMKHKTKKKMLSDIVYTYRHISSNLNS